MIIQTDKRIHPFSQEEESPHIRKALALAIRQAQESYNQSKDDHRYAQGFLHALVQFQKVITKPQTFVSRETEDET